MNKENKVPKNVSKDVLQARAKAKQQKAKDIAIKRERGDWIPKEISGMWSDFF